MGRRRVEDQSETAKHVRRLVGAWEGRGRGRFPTIDPFRYRESFRVTVRDPDEPTFHYEQQTWIVSDGEDDGTPSHWESGFFIVKEDGTVDLLNAQESDRVEVLAGALFVDDSDPYDCEMRLESRVHGHDPRVLATARTIRFNDDRLEYLVRMSTTRAANLETHLEGVLTRAAMR